MADCESVADLDKDEQVTAIAKHIIKALGTSKNPTDDMIRFLSDFKLSLSKSKISQLSEKNEGTGIEEQLNSLQEKVMSWDSDQSMIWDRGPDEASEYLKIVDEVQQLTESLANLSLDEDQGKKELLRRAHSILQMAMARLENEFVHILIENRQNLEPEHVSFHSSEDDMSFVDSTSSVDDDPAEDTQAGLQRESSKGSEEFIIDLVRAEVIPDLKCIVEVMFVSSYDQECCQAYIRIRKDALEECYFMLEVENLSIEEVLQLDWSVLNSMIKKWIRAMKIFVRIYLASEKRLSDQIFGPFGLISQTCFVEVSKGLIFQLLSFGEAVSLGPRSPEKLFRLLYMYDGLADLLPDIVTLFSEEAGSSVRTESHEVLRRLGDAVRGTLGEFVHAVRTNTSTTPFAGGGIHHLTRYVMNYIKALTDYSGTLNTLLQHNGEDHSSSLSALNMAIQEEDEQRCCNVSPFAQCLQSVASILESNLERKSKLYKNASLEHIFLMNNVCYMAEKAKNSDLGAHLGESWIRRHNGKFQRHAVNYERASWSSLLSLFRAEGICDSKSGSVSRAVLKERFQGFNIAFEEIYKAQTAWLIPNLQLRDDLRISISQKVLPAYRTFIGRYSNVLEGERHGDKYIKYSEDNLQEYLLDLFEGSRRSLPNSHRR